MVPLTTRQGLSVTQLAERIGDRDVLIWGTGDLAQDVSTSLRKAGFAPRAYLHGRPPAGGGRLHGLPILSSADVLARFDSPNRPFIVLAAAAYRRQAEQECLAAGLRCEVDFISHLTVPRPHAIVEVAGTGRPGFSNWPSDTIVSPPSDRMSAAAFERVLAKLAIDLPLLSHLDLTLSGEPLMNPELPEIIRLAERFVPCTVITGLPVDVPLEPIMAAGPSRFDIIAVGIGDSDDRATPGFSWAAFRQRLEQMRAFISAYRPTTRFQVRLYRSHSDPPDLEQRWREILHGSGIRLAMQTPYIMPYDYVLSFCETGELPAAARQVANVLPWNLDRALALSAEDAHLPCLSQRIFPVIHPNRSVALCHLYQGPILAGDYLSVSWENLLHRRHRAEQCRLCQHYGLHRLDVDVLQRRHPNALLEPDLENTHVIQ
jgi:hypothetical protein